MTKLKQYLFSTAITMFTSEGSLEDNIKLWKKGIKEVKTGSVTYAIKRYIR